MLEFLWWPLWVYVLIGCTLGFATAFVGALWRKHKNLHDRVSKALNMAGPIVRECRHCGETDNENRASCRSCGRML